MSGLQVRKDRIIESLGNAELGISLLYYGKHSDAELVAKAEEALLSAEAAVGDFLEVVRGPKPQATLSPAERVESLASAVEGIAHARGAARLEDAELSSLVVEFAPEAQRAFWHGESEGLSRGHVQSSAELRELLQQRRVLCWFDGTDRSTRVIDTGWLSAHAEIFSYVRGEPEPGRRCRFCCLAEPQAGNLTRSTFETSAYVLVHEACRPFWLQWEGIAAQYTDVGEAMEADKEAGRVPGERAPLPPLPTEAGSIADANSFGSRSEQGVPASGTTPLLR